MEITEERYEQVRNYISEIMRPYMGQPLTRNIRAQVEYLLTEALKFLELNDHYEVALKHDGFDIKPKTSTTMSDWVPSKSVPYIHPDDSLLVTWDGITMMGPILEADVDQGYVIMKMRIEGQDLKVTLRGKVEITFNGKPAFRVEQNT